MRITDDNSRIVGLGVTGGNLALNVERHGCAVIGYDPRRVHAFLSGAAAERQIVGAGSPQGLVSRLNASRRIMLMMPAGR